MGLTLEENHGSREEREEKGRAKKTIEKEESERKTRERTWRDGRKETTLFLNNTNSYIA